MNISIDCQNLDSPFKAGRNDGETARYRWFSLSDPQIIRVTLEANSSPLQAIPKAATRPCRRSPPIDKAIFLPPRCLVFHLQQSSPFVHRARGWNEKGPLRMPPIQIRDVCRQSNGLVETEQHFRRGFEDVFSRKSECCVANKHFVCECDEQIARKPLPIPVYFFVTRPDALEVYTFAFVAKRVFRYLVRGLGEQASDDPLALRECRFIPLVDPSRTLYHNPHRLTKIAQHLVLNSGGEAHQVLAVLSWFALLMAGCDSRMASIARSFSQPRL